ncbi:MAG: peptidoglycan DD-metalloendopeptidase family protein, partial [Prevotellaceae bacterium]|nr:peptidoglycan DD-metalloendopeptidase family protein [Prevotellaceae bacterium]
TANLTKNARKLQSIYGKRTVHACYYPEKLEVNSKHIIKVKIIHVALLFLLLTVYSKAQTVKTNYNTETKSFVENYNSRNYDSIFMAFSDEMKKALPLNEAINFFKNLQSQAGKIINYELTEYNTVFYLYKMTFEKDVFNVSISYNEQLNIQGFYVKIFQENVKNTTKLILPFDDEWTVVWGGDTKDLNYHIENVVQKNAFDFLVKDNDGRTYKTNGAFNEDYYAFGKKIIAPCDGRIVLSVDGIKDNIPGKVDLYFVPGNTVIIKTVNDEYILFAHLKQYSVKVKEGQDVQQGDIIGYCGNSGNSTEAHLHFHIQNTEDMNTSTGIKCYFEKITVNNKDVSDYSPVKNEKIENR